MRVGDNLAAEDRSLPEDAGDASDDHVPLTAAVPGAFPREEDTRGRRARRARKARFRRKFGLGILTTFALILFIVTIAVFLASGAIVHYTAQRALEDELSRRLEGIAGLTADSISKDYGYFAKELRDKSAKDSARARDELAAILRRLRTATDMREIVLVAPDGRVLARADETSAVRGGATISVDEEETLRRALGSGLAVTSKLYWYQSPTDDQGRYYKSAYAPVVLDEAAPKGKEPDRRLAVGVEVPADIAAAVDRVDRNFVALGAGACMVVLLCAYLLVRQRVHTPIYRLVRAMEGDRDGDEPGPPVKARVRWTDEIGALTERYNQMVDRLMRQDAELRRLYAEARERAEFLRGYSNYLVEGVPTGVVAVDPTGRVTVWNEAAARIIGLAPDKALGKEKREALGADHPVARALAGALQGAVSDQAIVAIGQAGDAEAGEADHEDAGARLVELAAAPIRDERGALLGAAALVNDRTELERLRRSAVRNERLAAVGRLAAGLAHEIRNPLGAIQGFAELLERQQKKAEKPVEEATRLVTRLRGEVDELNRFVTEFLAFARDSQIKRSPTDVTLVARRAVETALAATGVSADEVKALLEGKPARPRPADDSTPRALGDGELRVVLDFAQDPGLETFPVDSTAFRMALVNVAKNALEAMHLRGTLTVRVRRSNDRVTVRVRDTGPGIPSDLLEKIFDPFFTTKDKGVGLGLAIAHKAVVAHGGKINVRVPESGGTEFVLRIPAERGDTLGDEDPEKSGIREALPGEDDVTPARGPIGPIAKPR
jgi:PAS domain S-box-containing protein